MIVYKELSSIEKDLKIPAKTLYGISNSISRHYHEKNIPKADGGTRTLSVPDEALKRVQRAIAEKLLVYEPISKYATAYRIGGGVKQNAACHVGKEVLLKLDIYHFFDSINYATVKEKAFPADKYAEPIRILLAMLCYNGEALPQGAPTSPVISNIIMRDFDETVGAWCEERNIRYTRYCDDMTFSGSFEKTDVLRFVSEQLRARGFRLHEKKTHYLTAGTRKTVTGVVVNQKPNTQKDYRREIRQAVYYCEKFGTEAHLQHAGIQDTPVHYLSRLLGKVNYVLQITPTNQEFLNYKNKLLALIQKAR